MWYFSLLCFDTVGWATGRASGLQKKKTGYCNGLLVVMELCTTYSSSSPVVTTTSTILCFNKHRLTQVHPENGHLNGERERESELYVYVKIFTMLHQRQLALAAYVSTCLPLAPSTAYYLDYHIHVLKVSNSNSTEIFLNWTLSEFTEFADVEFLLSATLSLNTHFLWSSQNASFK